MECAITRNIDCSDGSNADGSAILDVKSSSKGFLMPRMTEAQKNAVSNPASGLMIFQTDGESGFIYDERHGPIYRKVRVGLLTEILAPRAEQILSEPQMLRI